MAGRIQKLEIEVEVKRPADELYEIFRRKEEVSTKKAEVVAVHDRDLESKSSIQSWNFIVDGKVEHVKERVSVDEENKSVCFVALEGDMLKQYKSYKIILHVIPKGEGSIVKWSWEYEKLQEDVPTPPQQIRGFSCGFHPGS